MDLMIFMGFILLIIIFVVVVVAAVSASAIYDFDSLDEEDE